MKTSYNYYPSEAIRQLKKNNNNLNYSAVELNYLEVKLEQFLDFTFKLLHPLFSDGNEKIVVKDHNYHKEKLDDDFDNAITFGITKWKWVVIIIGLFYQLYCFVFRIKSTHYLSSNQRNKYKKPINRKNTCETFINNNNFKSTSPP